MSYADIQAQASLLPLAERIELTRYLTALETEDQLRALLSQRMRAALSRWMTSKKSTNSSKRRGAE